MSVFPPVPQDDAGLAFVQQARAFLRDEYVPKIRRCLERLPASDLWWRPTTSSNSVGNLVLHICGNARQWIVAGVEGRPDLRVRDAEFSAEQAIDGEGLDFLLKNTFVEIDRVLAALSPQDLSRPLTIQGFKLTVLQAVFHVVEHVSGHTGQIMWITKYRLNDPLDFYDIQPDGTVRTTWGE